MYLNSKHSINAAKHFFLVTFEILNDYFICTNYLSAVKLGQKIAIKIEKKIDNKYKRRQFIQLKIIHYKAQT